jgi:hypothetical protein
MQKGGEQVNYCPQRRHEQLDMSEEIGYGILTRKSGQHFQ